MEIKEALTELRAARSTLNAQLLQRNTLNDRTNARFVGPDRLHATSYATIIVDTINALERIDAAIHVLENEAGDAVHAISKALYCLKGKSFDSARNNQPLQ